MRVSPEDYATEAGRRSQGEYLRGERMATQEDGSQWLCLDACEDLSMDLPRGRQAHASMNAYYNAEYAKRGLWVRIEVSG